MRDPYLYEDCPVLKNKLDIKIQEKLDNAEADYVVYRLMARLWKIHPFREGNTRTTVTFCRQYADEIGLKINRELFEKNSYYMRTALVAYNAFFSDGNDFSKIEYLEQIVYDAMTNY